MKEKSRGGAVVTLIVAGQRYVRRVDESKTIAREMFDEALVFIKVLCK